MESIERFDGDNEFLSNFFPRKVVYQGLEYPSSENAFQAAKVHVEGSILALTTSMEETNKQRQSFGFLTVTPGQAKRLGGKRGKIVIRSDWEEIKDKVMYDVLKCKFTQNEDLKELLLQTNPKELIEGNYWHDNYWGNCSCDGCKQIEGKNTLGKILMKLREEL